MIEYQKFRIKQNPEMKLKKINLDFKKRIDDTWTAYIFNLEIILYGRNTKIQDILFSDGKYITSELNDPSGLDIKLKIHPKLDRRYFDEKFLLAGKYNAKHKIVLFSDPLCPNCKDLMTELIEKANNNPELLALYYIAYPLDTLHPTAITLIKAAKIAKDLGIKDVEYRLYKSNIEKYYNPYETKDQLKALETFNIIFKSNITMAQIENIVLDDIVQEEITLAKEAFVRGTPTLFLDGEIDLMKTKYQNIFDKNITVQSIEENNNNLIQEIYQKVIQEENANNNNSK